MSGYTHNFDHLIALCKQISDHPDLPSHLKIIDGEPIPWLLTLYDMNTSHDGFDVDIEEGLPAPDELDSLIEDLEVEACNLFITDQGQHSTAFITVRQLGFNTRPGESDSFGPLTSVFINKDKTWQYCFG